MTRLFGVMGFPIAHSRSPAMHNAALRALAIDGVYVPWAVPPSRLAQAVEAAAALGCTGFNVTLPHKAAVMGLMDDVEPMARTIGAVNTAVREGERWIGTNTDALGLVRSLVEAGVEPRGLHVVVIGAGGAARAAVVGLAAAGAASVTVGARRSGEAEALVREVRAGCGATHLTAGDLATSLAASLPRAGLLVQATSATLGDRTPGFAAALQLERLPAHAAVCDLVYKPLQTEVLRHARSLGLRCVDGLGMLLHQGALAFERWTGERAPVEVMREALTGPAA